MNNFRCSIYYENDQTSGYLHDIPCSRRDLGSYDISSVSALFRLNGSAHEITCSTPSYRGKDFIPPADVGPDSRDGFFLNFIPPNQKESCTLQATYLDDEGNRQFFKADPTSWVNCLNLYGFDENPDVYYGGDFRAVCIARNTDSRQDKPLSTATLHRPIKPDTNPFYQPGQLRLQHCMKLAENPNEQSLTDIANCYRLDVRPSGSKWRLDKYELGVQCSDPPGFLDSFKEKKAAYDAASNINDYVKKACSLPLEMDVGDDFREYCYRNPQTVAADFASYVKFDVKEASQPVQPNLSVPEAKEKCLQDPSCGGFLTIPPGTINVPNGGVRFLTPEETAISNLVPTGVGTIYALRRIDEEPAVAYDTDCQAYAMNTAFSATSPGFASFLTNPDLASMKNFCFQKKRELVEPNFDCTPFETLDTCNDHVQCQWDASTTHCKNNRKLNLLYSPSCQFVEELSKFYAKHAPSVNSTVTNVFSEWRKEYRKSHANDSEAVCEILCPEGVDCIHPTPSFLQYAKNELGIAENDIQTGSYTSLLCSYDKCFQFGTHRGKMTSGVLRDIGDTCASEAQNICAIRSKVNNVKIVNSSGNEIKNDVNCILTNTYSLLRGCGSNDVANSNDPSTCLSQATFRWRNQNKIDTDCPLKIILGENSQWEITLDDDKINQSSEDLKERCRLGKKNWIQPPSSNQVDLSVVETPASFVECVNFLNQRSISSHDVGLFEEGIPVSTSQFCSKIDNSVLDVLKMKTNLFIDSIKNNDKLSLNYSIDKGILNTEFHDLSTLVVQNSLETEYEDDPKKVPGIVKAGLGTLATSSGVALIGMFA